MTDNAFLIKTRYAVSADVHISTFFLILLHWLVFYVVYDFKLFLMLLWMMMILLLF